MLDHVGLPFFERVRRRILERCRVGVAPLVSVPESASRTAGPQKGTYTGEYPPSCENTIFPPVSSVASCTSAVAIRLYPEAVTDMRPNGSAAHASKPLGPACERARRHLSQVSRKRVPKVLPWGYLLATPGLNYLAVRKALGLQ